MKYKTFIRKYMLVLFGLIIAFYVLAFNLKMYYLDPEYPLWMHVKQEISSENNNEIDLLILGDSRAKAGIKPALFAKKNVQAMNLALGGGTPLDGYYTLKKYLKNNSKPRYLVLSYSPFHLSSYEVYWGRTLRFNYLDWGDYYAIHKKAQELEDSITLGQANSYIDWLFNPARYMTEITNGIKLKRWKMSARVTQYVQKSKGHFYFGRENGASGLNQEVRLMTDFRPSKLLDSYLKELLMLAKAENIPVYWFALPMNQSSYNKLPANFIADYDRYIHRKAQQYEFTVLNRLIALPDEYFGDPSHLYKGAKGATQQLVYLLLDNNDRPSPLCETFTDFYC